jgi:succinyl-CoA synthetase beta subunit
LAARFQQLAGLHRGIDFGDHFRFKFPARVGIATGSFAEVTISMLKKEKRLPRAHFRALLANAAMNIHEYQAKELLEKFGVATTRGKVASTPDEAEAIAREIGDVDLVVKAQIHAGGRGKGTFGNGFKGGVHVVKSRKEVRDLAGKMLGQTLVTHQTGPAGRVVNKVLVAESAEIAREIYFAILLDRATAAPLIVASTEGGVEIEAVAEKSPEKIMREPVDPLAGLQPFQARKLAKRLGFDPAQSKAATKLFDGLYRTFVGLDCSMVEVNPLVVTTKGDVLALDAKFNFDDNALYRHPEVAAMRDTAEEDPREVDASKHGLNYIGLDGNIACLVNGAGLAMATMDIIKFYGGSPANFLDVGGSATEEQVTEAFKILISDKNVKAILVNIFGGIMKCDVIAQGIINAAKAVKLSVPLVVRLEGTNVDAGKKLLAGSGIAVIAADDLADAAQKVVKAAKAK